MGAALWVEAHQLNYHAAKFGGFRGIKVVEI